MDAKAKYIEDSNLLDSNQDAKESYMNIKLNDTSDNENEENTAGFIQEEQIYYHRGRGAGNRDSDENSKGEKSQQRIRQAFQKM